MTMIDSTLDDFGQSLGMDSLSFDDQGVITLEIEGMGDLFFEKNEEDNLLAIYLVREIKHPSLQTYQKAFSYANMREEHPVTVTVGLHGEGDLAFMTRLAGEDVTLPHIQDAITTLKKLHSRMEAAL